MRYYGSIEDNKDLVTKEYVDAMAVDGGCPFIISNVAPNDKNKIWIRNGLFYYYDASTLAWESMKITTDKTVVPAQASEDFHYSTNCPFIISDTAPSNKSKFWIKDGTIRFYNYAEQAWLSIMFLTDQ